jgi:hypothetical protein
LEGANLWDANLERANLWDANLERATLLKANLEGAFLWDANLAGVYLVSANLKGANLQGANLSGAKLQAANLENVIWELESPEQTITATLPDGIKWTSDTDLQRFIDPKHPEYESTLEKINTIRDEMGLEVI